MTKDVLVTFGQALLATGLFASAAWCAWCVAVTVAHRACAATRACVAAAILLWLSVAAFLLLSSVDAFQGLHALGLSVAASGVSHLIARRSTDPRTLLVQDFASLRTVRLGTWGVIATAS